MDKSVFRTLPNIYAGVFFAKTKISETPLFFKKKLYQRFLNGSKYAFVKAIQMFKAVIENSM